MISFRPPHTRAEYNELMDVIKFTSMANEFGLRTYNAYMKHVDPQEPPCNSSCSRAWTWQSMLATYATREAGDWLAAIELSERPSEPVQIIQQVQDVSVDKAAGGEAPDAPATDEPVKTKRSRKKNIE
jgi:hypothetical protein